ncbi:glycosyltransferase family 4 protein [Couchioplanes caeruleus]|uniref:Glycosyltransferase involved in cell wall biosynthesis n=1 Tax=Couchioplanes caeruleus TaxID=56438 RepID=A0A3N1GPB7_9ACTN|nr:glycosyltransferase family 4 protein [Couchioplanes caeruleus]ROP32061.1 glycosyltransferase involved in cell wall biosynthesis [Couchioplanes caeruleus]
MPLRLLVLDQAVGVWGAQAYLLRMAPRLARHGVEMTLAGPPELDLAQAWKAAGLPHIALPLPIVRSVRSDGHRGRLSARAMLREGAQLWRTRALIRDAITSSGCDAVHANGHAIHLDAALAARAAGRPAVLHLHEEMPHRFGAVLRAAAVRTADASVAVSRAVAAGLSLRTRSRVTVIANGVDTAIFRPGAADAGVRAGLGAAPDDVLVVAVTRIDPDKRIEDIITAMTPHRGRPGWHLAIVGVTSSYPEYARQMRELARETLGSQVTFAGRRSDVADIFRAADVLVHAGLVEGMPLGMLEAQACGVPVVGYRVAGVPEAVVDGGTGLLAPAGDVAALRRHLSALLADCELRTRLGAGGIAHVQRRHTLDGQIVSYVRLLDELLGRTSGRTATARRLAGRPS